MVSRDTVAEPTVWAYPASQAGYAVLVQSTGGAVDLLHCTAVLLGISYRYLGTLLDLDLVDLDLVVPGYSYRTVHGTNTVPCR